MKRGRKMESNGTVIKNSTFAFLGLGLIMFGFSDTPW